MTAKSGGDDSDLLREMLTSLSPYRLVTALTALEEAEHKRPDQDLRAANERLARILDTIPVGVSFIGVDRQVIFANAEAERILRLRRNRIMGVAYDDPSWNGTPFGGGVFPQEEKLIVRVVQQGEIVRDLEAFVDPAGGGGRIAISVSAAPLRSGSEGEIQGMVVAFRDISVELSERRFARRIVNACTRGKLRWLERKSELPARLAPVGDPVSLTDAAAQEGVQKAVVCLARGMGFPAERIWDLTTAVGEACNNARGHARGGMATICRTPLSGESGDPALSLVQVWVEDSGAVESLDGPNEGSSVETELERLAPGFCLIASGCDRAFLYRAPAGTTLVLEMERRPPAPSWLLAGRTEEDLTERERVYLRRTNPLRGM